MAIIQVEQKHMKKLMEMLFYKGRTKQRHLKIILVVFIYFSLLWWCEVIFQHLWIRLKPECYISFYRNFSFSAVPVFNINRKTWFKKIISFPGLLLWDERSPNLFLFLSKKKPWERSWKHNFKKSISFNDIKTDCFK